MKGQYSILLTAAYVAFALSFFQPVHLFSQSRYLQFDHILLGKGTDINSVRNMVQDRFGFMWFATWEGAVRYDGFHLKVYSPTSKDSIQNPRDRRVYELFYDSRKRIWAGSQNGLSCFDAEKDSSILIR